MLQFDCFRDDFCAIAQFGVLNNGGVTRLAFSKADHDARNYLISKMRQANLDITIDPVGNIHGRRNGNDPALSPVVLGSHLDTVPHGGHYDGVVGVLAALEIVRTLNDADIETMRPIEIINFSAEESSRFGTATIGSKAITGKLTVTQLNEIRDNDGDSLGQILRNGGYQLDELPSAIMTQDDVHAYLEIHIEQGPILENEALDIGIISGIAAPSRFHVTIIGRNDHSGTTPMSMRCDALAGAAELILAIEQIAISTSRDMVATVGEAIVEHGAMNVVPGEVKLSIDMRDTDFATKIIAIEKMKQRAREIGLKRGLKIDFTTLCDDYPVTLDTVLVDKLANEAEKLKLSYKIMPSGAGHDAMHFADIAPTGLIFIPSIKGISHNIAEKTSMKAIEKGIQLLFNTTIKLANEK